MAPIALITRPDEDAEPLAAALIARGIEVLREPLLTIRPVANAHLDLAGVQALLFTSANGVRAFASLSSRRDLPALAVGDATAKTLKDAGFLKVESAGGAVEDLAALATRKLDPHGGPLFHAAGSAVAGDLAGLLGKDGFELRRVVLYEAETAHALSAETREKLAAGEIGLVLLFSPRTAETFLRLVRDAGPEVTAGVGKAIALCLSPAVARAIEPLSWRGVKTAERPELPAMLALVDVAAAELRPQGNGPGPILDLEPETVPNPAEIEAALKRMTPKRRSGGFVVALLVLLALGAVAYFTRASWQPPLMAMLDRGISVDTADGTSADIAPGETVTAPAAGATAAAAEGLAQRIGELESDLGAMKAALADLETRTGEAASQDWQKAVAELGTLVAEHHEKLGQLEQDVTALGSADRESAIDELRKLVEQQTARIEALEQRPAPGAGTADGASAPAPSPELGYAVEALRDQNSALTAALDEARNEIAELRPLAQRVEALEASAAKNAAESGNVALLLAVARLSSALNGPRPFLPELTTLNELAAKDPVLAGAVKQAAAPIAPHAENGIATVGDLRDSFPDLADALARSDTGDAVADAAGAEPEGWFRRLMASLADLVTVRPTGADVEGDTVGARVARAEAAVKAGDLETAATELDGLPTAAGWVASARARAAVAPALDALEALAVARLGQATPGTNAPDGASGG